MGKREVREVVCLRGKEVVRRKRRGYFGAREEKPEEKREKNVSEKEE